MTGAVTTASVPYSYYNVLNPNNPIGVAAPTTPATDTTGTDTDTDTTGTTTTSGTPSTGTTTLPSNVLSLLQTFEPNNSASNQISTLLGTSSSSSGLDSLLGDSSDSDSTDSTTALENNLLTAAYGQTLAAAYAAAPQNTGNTDTGSATQTAPVDNTVQNAIAANNAAINAYNNTVLQQAKAVQAANNYGPDGTTPLVA